MMEESFNEVILMSQNNTESVSSTMIDDETQSTLKNESYESLKKNVSSLSSKLEESQKLISSLLNEKKQWAEKRDEMTPKKDLISELRIRLEQAKRSTELAFKEKENLVVKFAMSEQGKLKAENEVKILTERLEKVILDCKNFPANSDKITELQARNEQIQLEVKKLETKSDDLKKLNQDINGQNLKLQELVKIEKKKNQTLHENITRLTKDLENSRKQAKDVEKLREKEAVRMCAEVAAKNALEKAFQLEKNCESVKKDAAKIPQLGEEIENLKNQLKNVEIERDSLLDERTMLADEFSRSENILDFTKKITEENSELRTVQIDISSKLNIAETKIKNQKEEINLLKKEILMLKSSFKLPININSITDYQDLHESEKRIKILENELDDLREISSQSKKRDNLQIKDLQRQLNRLNITRMKQQTFSNQQISPAESLSIINESETNSIDLEDPIVQRLARTQQKSAELQKQLDYSNDLIDELRNEIRFTHQILHRYGHEVTHPDDFNEVSKNRLSRLMSNLDTKTSLRSEISRLVSALNESLQNNETLTRNVETMGEEIERLRRMNCELKSVLSNLMMTHHKVELSTN